MVSDLNEKEWISNQCVNRKLWLTHLSFQKWSIAPWERPSVLSQWLSSHSSLLSNGAYPPSPACLGNFFFSHRVSWQPSRGFPALVSTISFKCGVDGDAPLSVLSASDSEVCPGPREEPGSWSQSDPSGSWEVLGSWGLLLLHFAWQARLHQMWLAKLPSHLHFP